MSRARDLTTDLGAMGLDDPARFLAQARAHGLSGTDEDLERRRSGLVRDLQTGRRWVEISPAASLMALPSALDKVAPLLMGRQRQLLRTDDWPGLVLGDQPVSLFQGGRLAPSIGMGVEGVQVLMPLSPQVLLLITDQPREAALRTLAMRYPTIREPWWSFANKVAWLTSQRFVNARTIGDLRAAECLLPPGERRRDLRDLSPEQAAALRERDRQRRAEWRRTGLL